MYLFGRGNAFSLERVWPELRERRLTDRIRFGAPIFFVLGRHDEQVPAALAKQYYETIDAPCKRVVWFEHSAHHPPFEEADRLRRGRIEPVTRKASNARA